MGVGGTATVSPQWSVPPDETSKIAIYGESTIAGGVKGSTTVTLLAAPIAAWDASPWYLEFLYELVEGYTATQMSACPSTGSRTTERQVPPDKCGWKPISVQTRGDILFAAGAVNVMGDFPYLVADLREREVIPHLEPLLGAGGAGREPALVKHQIHTGDYLLCRSSPDGGPDGGRTSTVVACFERKSLKDFVQSFKDGRYENRKKMLELRAQTGCQLYYIVEGAAFPNPNWVVCSGTKYQAILTAMTTLPLASGIHIIQTKDTQHTALRLRDFVRALERIPDPYLYPVEEGGLAGGELATSEGTLVPTAVTGVYEKDPDTLCMDLWARLTGISITTAKILVCTCSVREFLTGHAVDIAKFKLPTGRLLVKKGRDSLKDLRDGRVDAGIKLLAGVNGLTVPMARQILGAIPVQTHQVHYLCMYSVEELAKFPLVQKSRTVKLGKPRAARILKMLHWKTGCEAAPPAQPAAVAPQPAAVAPQPAAVAPQPAAVAPQPATAAPSPQVS